MDRAPERAKGFEQCRTGKELRGMRMKDEGQLADAG